MYEMLEVGGDVFKLAATAETVTIEREKARDRLVDIAGKKTTPSAAVCKLQ